MSRTQNTRTVGPTGAGARRNTATSLRAPIPSTSTSTANSNANSRNTGAAKKSRSKSQSNSRANAAAPESGASAENGSSRVSATTRPASRTTRSNQVESTSDSRAAGTSGNGIVIGTFPSSSRSSRKTTGKPTPLKRSTEKPRTGKRRRGGGGGDDDGDDDDDDQGNDNEDDEDDDDDDDDQPLDRPPKGEDESSDEENSDSNSDEHDNGDEQHHTSLNAKRRSGKTVKTHSINTTTTNSKPSRREIPGKSRQAAESATHASRGGKTVPAAIATASTSNKKRRRDEHENDVEDQQEASRFGASRPSAPSSRSHTGGKSLASLQNRLGSTERKRKKTEARRKLGLSTATKPADLSTDDEGPAREDEGDVTSDESEADVLRLDTVEEEEEGLDSENEDGETPRTRSASFVGFNWKCQDILVKADVVKRCLSYHKSRTFVIPSRPIKKGKLSDPNRDFATDLSGDEDEAAAQGRPGSRVTYKELTYKRGQLIYVLPDPSWLIDEENQNRKRSNLSIEELREEDWWLGLVLDCCELRYKDGPPMCMLRVAWCYSPKQALALFKGTGGRDEKILRGTEFWDNEMLASDHIDFVCAESTGDRYRGGYDQNAEEIQLLREGRKIVSGRKEKICIRLSIHGLEESDVDRMTDAHLRTDPATLGYQRYRYIGQFDANLNLRQVLNRWATDLSHGHRRSRSGKSTVEIRQTTAMDDAHWKRIEARRARGISDTGFGSSGKGGKGKGKGRGKSILVGRVSAKKPPASQKSRRPHVATKSTKTSSASGRMGGKSLSSTGFGSKGKRTANKAPKGRRGF